MKSVLSSDRSDWEIIKIPEVIFFQEGPGVRKWQFTESGVKLLNVGNINKGKLNLSTTKIYLSEEEAFGKYAHFLVDADDLLIACSGIVLDNFHNKITFAGKEDLPLCLNTSTMRFKALDKNKIDLNFFKYFLQTQHFNKQLSRLITGSAQLNFGPSHIKKIDLFLPPLAEQQKIAEILDAADALRQKDQQLIDRYTTLSQSLFLDMFGDIFRNPNNFVTCKLETLLKNKKDMVDGPFGSSINTKIDYCHDGEIPVIRTKNVSRDSKFVVNDLKFMRREKYETVIRSQVLPGDIVLTKVGTIGNICIIPNTYQEYVLSTTGSCRIRINEDNTNKIFLVYYLNFYKPRMLDIASAGVQAFLNMKHIKGFDILCPPITLQNQFANHITSIEKQKQQAQASLAQSNNLFNSLLQKAFTGGLTA